MEKWRSSGPARRAFPAPITWLPWVMGSPSSRPFPGWAECSATGFPPTGLPKDVLDQEIDQILALGVETRTNCRVGKDVKWEELKTYDAVFVAAGAWRSLPLRVPGEQSAGVMSGVTFLKKVNSGEKVDLGERVAVIGGGNTAMDAARSALRLGAKPLIIYRRTKEEMPAWEEEISEAEEEKIEFIFLTSPVNILSENGKVKGIECIKNLLGPPGKDGRREPRPIENSNFTLPVDSVISAIGEAPDLSFLPSELQKSKDAIPVDEAGATSLEKVFAGGDMVAQPRTVSYAIGSGKKAAMAIDATLRGKNAAEAIRLARWGEKGSLSMARYRSGGGDGIAQEVVRFSELNTAYFPRQARKPKERLSMERAHEGLLRDQPGPLPGYGPFRSQALLQLRRVQPLRQLLLLLPRPGHLGPAGQAGVRDQL